MKIFTGEAIKEADKYTIENEPIASIELMEKAANVIAKRIEIEVKKETPLLFLIGKGNNGGDGLAVARILHNAGYDCSIYSAFDVKDLSEECRYNMDRLPTHIIKTDLENIADKTVIIDALLGTGVKGAIKEPVSTIIEKVNTLLNKVISIDLPSGMKSEFENKGQTIIQADLTLALEFPKLAMLLPEVGEYCGKIEILPIGISKEYTDKTNTDYQYITPQYIESIKLKRAKFAHKGTYGHALLICGSRGMIGAAILATGAALRSGCGLVTAHIPAEDRYALNMAYPSAITSLDQENVFSETPYKTSKYNAIGIGCGLGINNETISAFKNLLASADAPFVIDADALNIIAIHSKLRYSIPQGSILTPHLGELEQLIGPWTSEEEKIGMVRRLAIKLKVIVVVKGAHTMVCLSDGTCFFNSTGNSGMAKGGSGDVLTGYITGLLARGYSSEHAAILGVYTHGLAGDKAAERYGCEAMNSKDLIDYLAV